MTSKRPRVLIAESQLPTRQGLRLLLQRNGFDVQSSPGGPTSIRLVLPPWQPVAADIAEPALL